MFCVAICDDDEILCAQLERTLEPYIENESIKADVFYSGEKLYDALSNGQHYDLIFLDIELPFMNGVDLGNKIRTELENERTHIVYISAKQAYAMELFAVRPMNFLVKPISGKAVIENVERAMRLSEMYDSFFEFKFGKEYFRIPYGDILYFESRNRKIQIHTKHGTKEAYGRISALEKKAPPNFVRIHHSYLVNRTYVTYWKSEEILLTGMISLPVSQAYRKSVGRFLLQGERE